MKTQSTDQLARDHEARLKEARYRRGTPAEEQLTSSLAGLASRDIDAELPDAQRHMRLGPERVPPLSSEPTNGKGVTP